MNIIQEEGNLVRTWLFCKLRFIVSRIPGNISAPNKLGP